MLPALDRKVAEPCVIPLAASGDNAKGYAAKITGALATCKAKHGNVVATYNTIRKGLAK